MKSYKVNTSRVCVWEGVRRAARERLPTGQSGLMHIRLRLHWHNKGLLQYICY